VDSNDEWSVHAHCRALRTHFPRKNTDRTPVPYQVEWLQAEGCWDLVSDRVARGHESNFWYRIKSVFDYPLTWSTDWTGLSIMRSRASASPFAVIMVAIGNETRTPRRDAPWECIAGTGATKCARVPYKRIVTVQYHKSTEGTRRRRARNSSWEGWSGRDGGTNGRLRPARCTQAQLVSDRAEFSCDQAEFACDRAEFKGRSLWESAHSAPPPCVASVWPFRNIQMAHSSNRTVSPRAAWWTTGALYVVVVSSLTGGLLLPSPRPFPVHPRAVSDGLSPGNVIGRAEIAADVVPPHVWRRLHRSWHCTARHFL